jgi:hypothetical protein
VPRDAARTTGKTCSNIRSPSASSTPPSKSHLEETDDATILANSQAPAFGKGCLDTFAKLSRYVIAGNPHHA